jgi:hypothetical protein
VHCYQRRLVHTTSQHLLALLLSLSGTRRVLMKIPVLGRPLG